MRAQPPPQDSTMRYLGVFCINPTCGRPMDVRDAWPTDVSRNHGPGHHQSIQTVECPSCDRRSTYHPKEVRDLCGDELEFC
jgi:hypothetical protein